MRRAVTIIVIAFVAAVAVTSYYAVDAQRSSRKALKGSVAAFRLKDLDGKEVASDDSRFAGKRVAFCFVSAYSGISETFAKQVLAQQAKLNGSVVFVASGKDLDVRAMRTRIGGDALWLSADTTVSSAFKNAFEDMSAFNHVPALVVTESATKVLHASTGEMSDAEIATALAATAN